MPEVILNGPNGRIEARYHQGKSPKSPIAMMLHPHPLFGGNMNNEVIYHLYYAFAKRDFTVLRFNFRGVGRSQGEFDHGQGELSDAATVLDWLQTMFPESESSWVAGFSFGAWVGMQLLMRRPEIEGFISVSPPAGVYDFSFLAPCPSSGLVINGADDAVAPQEEVSGFVSKIKAQKGIFIEQNTIEGANHVFQGKIPELIDAAGAYVDRRKAQRLASANGEQVIEDVPQIAAEEPLIEGEEPADEGSAEDIMAELGADLGGSEDESKA